MESTQSAPEQAVAPWSTWQILAEPFLDTDIPEYRGAGRRVLKGRGITGWHLLVLRLITAGGLWWNLFWGEWAILDGRDILFGWLLNAVLLIAVAVGFWINWAIELVAFAALVPTARKMFTFAIASWGAK